LSNPEPHNLHIRQATIELLTTAVSLDQKAEHAASKYRRITAFAF